MSDDAAAVLADVAGLGPAFVVATGPAPDGATGWRPLADLAADPAVLGEQVVRTRDRLGVSEDRVAASVVFQGLAARVVAPHLGVAALHDRLPVLAWDTLYWRRWDAGVVPWWSPAPSSIELTSARLVEAVTEPLAALSQALRSTTAVSPRLLWGDVTAAVGGVLRVVSRERPEALERALRLADDLLAHPPLAGTGSVVRSPEGASVARRTCCLVYRAPGAVTCSDCVFGAGRAGPAPNDRGVATDLRRPGRPVGGSSR